MKNYHYLFALLVLTSCDLLDANQDERNSTSLEDLLGNNPDGGQSSADGSWQIGLLVEDGFDLTQNYTGVTLTFADLGVLEAAKAEEKFSGRWRIEREAGREELELTFPENTALGELGDDWRIVERTADQIVLEDREDGFVDRLVLVKTGQSQAIPSPFEGARVVANQLFQELGNSELSVGRVTSDGIDRSSLVQGSVLVFRPLGRLELQTSTNSTLVGNWQVGYNDKNAKLKLDLQDDGLGELLDEDWLLTAISAEVIQLREDDLVDQDELELRKN